MYCLAFIMIHVEYEFAIDKVRPKQYAWEITSWLLARRALKARSR